MGVVKSACVIWVVSVTTGPNIFGGGIACLAVEDTGPGAVGAGAGREQEIATATRNSPTATIVVSLVFIRAFFSSQGGNTSVDLVSIW